MASIMKHLPAFTLQQGNDFSGIGFVAYARSYTLARAAGQ
jgi:hypothetical protein